MQVNADATRNMQAITEDIMRECVVVTQASSLRRGPFVMMLGPLFQEDTGLFQKLINQFEVKD